MMDAEVQLVQDKMEQLQAFQLLAAKKREAEEKARLVEAEGVRLKTEEEAKVVEEARLAAEAAKAAEDKVPNVLPNITLLCLLLATRLRSSYKPSSELQLSDLLQFVHS
ncbi:unnamed protein product [Vicia faba]|uniref:Uncharacterized protein n=1 Tax=Vicia faba TaxID=3906 RepID=A0AAV0YEW4_VICFA|nr:unnamed protein product [Vicia faba]